MKFRCDRCGQRYSTADEPKTGQSYRILCLVCGGMVRLKGGEFPALPTFVADPAAAPGTADLEAGAEEPVLLALAPMAQQDPKVEGRQRIPRTGAAARGVRGRRWIRFAAAAGVALATAGAGVLLVSGGPRPEPAGDAPAGRGTSEAMAALAGTTPAPDSAASSIARAGAAPALPPQDRQGQRDEATPAPSAKSEPFSPPARPVSVSSPKPAPSPTGRAPSASRPGAVAPEPPAATAPSAPEAPPASAIRLSPEDVATAVAARRPAFESCLQEALRNEPRLLAGGIRVGLVMTVNPIGIATSPQIDDPLLQDTALGECLRSVARSLLFPAFEGEPFQVRIPLVLGK